MVKMSKKWPARLRVFAAGSAVGRNLDCHSRSSATTGNVCLVARPKSEAPTGTFSAGNLANVPGGSPRRLDRAEPARAPSEATPTLFV